MSVRRLFYYLFRIPALLISGAATLIGALNYLFWLGKIEPMNPDQQENDKIHK